MKLFAQKQVISKSLIISALLLMATSAFAADFNNELVKMDVNQNSDGSIKLNIYTDRPYNDQIIVNKKNDNKYVILLPETTNSLNIKPDISNASSLSNVDIKTQQYSSLPGKDYTKIIIDSKTPVNIIPQAHVAKKVVSEKKTVSRPVSAQQVQKTLPKRVLEQQYPITNNDFNTSSRQTTALTQPNYVARPQDNQTLVKREFSQAQPYSQVTKRENDASILKQVSPSSVQSEQVVLSEDNAESALTQNEQVALEDNAEENQINEADEKDKSSVENSDSENKSTFLKKLINFKQKVERKFKKILSIKISFASFMVVLQLILLVVLIKVVTDLIKKVQNPKETPTPTRRLILDNDETFDQVYPSYSNMDVYNPHKSNFEEDNKEGFNITSFPSTGSFSNNRSTFNKNLYSNNYKQSQQYSVQNDFYKPLSTVSKEEKMSIFDENPQDIEKTIFKNPLISISKQDEETLFDEPETVEENSPFNKETYSIQEQEDDFFGYSNNSDNEEDFFIFEEDEDDEVVSYQEDYNEDDDEYDEEYEYVDENEDEYEYEDESDEEYDSDEEYEYEDDVEEDVTTSGDEVESQTEVNPFEQLSVQAKYEIDSNKGFAQVNVNGLNAIIGYVGSKISVIRKFKEDVKGSMQVRLNEKTDNETSIYIIKIGAYKTLVEVKPDSIRQLLDL